MGDGLGCLSLLRSPSSSRCHLIKKELVLSSLSRYDRASKILTNDDGICDIVSRFRISTYLRVSSSSSPRESCVHNSEQEWARKNKTVPMTFAKATE